MFLHQYYFEVAFLTPPIAYSFFKVFLLSPSIYMPVCLGVCLLLPHPFLSLSDSLNLPFSMSVTQTFAISLCFLVFAVNLIYLPSLQSLIFSYLFSPLYCNYIYQVVLSVNEMQRKMFDSLYDISAGIRGTIQEKVRKTFNVFPIILFLRCFILFCLQFYATCRRIPSLSHALPHSHSLYECPTLSISIPLFLSISPILSLSIPPSCYPSLFYLGLFLSFSLFYESWSLLSPCSISPIYQITPLSNSVRAFNFCLGRLRNGSLCITIESDR